MNTPRLLAWAPLLALLTALMPAHAAIQQAFLVQNSGWMEPFYVDSASQLKPLVAAVAQAAADADDTVHTLAFSQGTVGNQSPRLLGSAKGAAGVAQLLAPLGLARKGAAPGAALADTDFQEAVTKTITGSFKAAPGIVWIFTNNKNSPGNDPATAARNREFYQLLHLEPSITKTVVFPLKMPVQGKLYAARGLMVYALAYGQPAADALTRILASGRLQQVLTRAPVRLKPVDQDALRIVPERLLDAPNMRASLGSDGRTLVLDVDAAALAPTVRLKATLQNLFYPYAIAHGEVAATLAAGQHSLPVQVAPAVIDNLAPGARQAVDVTFRLPVEQVPSPWSSQAIAAMGKQLLLPMRVTLSLDRQQLTLPPSFNAEMQALFPGDPISEVLLPPESVHSSRAEVPLLVRVQYPLLPVLVMVGAVLAALGGAAAFAVLATRSKRYPVHVDGALRHVVLKPFNAVLVHDANGTEVGQLRRGLGRPVVVRVADGHTLRLA
jgi:hypothetical protein